MLTVPFVILVKVSDVGTLLQMMIGILLSIDIFFDLKFLHSAFRAKKVIPTKIQLQVAFYP